MTFQDATEWVYGLARSRRRGTYALVILAAVAVIGWYGATISPFSQLPHAAFVLPLALPAVLALVTWLLIKPDVTRSGALGVVLAIDYETAQEGVLIASDFVEEVRRRLDASTSAYRFQVIMPSRLLFSPTQSRDVTARRLLARCRANFVVTGDIRTRTSGGIPTRVLRLEGLLCHMPIPLEVSAALAQDMRQVLPPQHRIACNNDLDGFELTSGLIACGAKYVIAVAAMLAQDFLYAAALLEELRADRIIGDATNQIPALARLRDLIPARLAECHLARSRQLYALWRQTREPSTLRSAEQAIEELDRLRPNDSNYYILKGICDFVLRNDLGGARACLETVRAQQRQDPTCLYGLAFLAAIEGNMNNAYDHYKHATKLDEASDTASTAFEVEEFIEWYLSVNSSRVQLHFCLGFLNYKRKGDLPRAKADLKTFLGATTQDQFPSQRAAAEKWIAEIDSKLNA